MKPARLIISALFGGFLLLVIGFLTVGSASAAGPPCNGGAPGNFGRAWDCSYFMNLQGVFNPPVNDDFSWLFVPVGATQYTGITPDWQTVPITYASFISAVHARLFDATSVVNEGRAAGMVDVMLGQSGPSFGGSALNGINYAQSHWADWVGLVSAYNSNAFPGYRVDYNVFYNFTGVDNNGFGFTYNDPTGITDCNAPRVCEPDIDFYQGALDEQFDLSVIFYYPGGQFIIKDKCGNLTGDTSAPPLPNSTLVITKDSSSHVAVEVGTQMTYTITASESQPFPLSSATITDTLPPQYAYVGPNPGSPPPTTVVGNTLTWSFSSPADDTILNTIANGPPQSLSVIVKSTSAGINIENTATGSAVDQFGPLNVIPGHTFNTVVVGAAPSIQAENGDVHAGGGFCGQNLSNGYVAGNPHGNSMGQYVVSASSLPAGISDFGSNGSIAGGSGDILKLGAGGGYAQVCRPDLLAGAIGNQGPDTGVITPTGPITTVDVGCLTVAGANCGVATGGSTAYFFSGSLLRLVDASGTINQKITIVATNGSVEISSPIRLGGPPVQPQDLPSLGIITDKDIYIDASVTRVDAYLFADGIINTCALTGALDQPCGVTTPTLTVNGFLMAHDILFSRLGPSGSSGPVISESIVLNPQIYLNPPLFFDEGSVSQDELQGLGERPPLF